jgi:hypothetical protein
MIGRVVSVLLASAIAGTAGIAGAQTVLGSAYITTLPSGADVWFDGTYVGHSPLVVDALAAGRHGLTLTKPGWNTVETAVVVSGGTLATSSTRLAPGNHGAGPNEPGTLVVRGVPPGGTVAVDGAPPSASREARAMAAGSHQVVVDAAGARTTRTFTIVPGTTTGLVFGASNRIERRSAVVALAEDYLPTNAFVVSGKRIVIHYLKHVIVAHFGESQVSLDGAVVAFDSAPESIGGKLYLPLELLEKVTGDVSKGR